MKTGKSLVDFAQEIERRAQAKKDFVVKSDAIAMTTDHHLTFGNEDFEVNDLAHGQIAQHLGIPKPYYDRMRADEPALLANNVNAWFKRFAQSDDRRMIRTLDRKARALLSDRYRPLENEELAQAALPALMERDLAIMSCEVTDRRLYIKAVDQSVARELAKIGGHFGDGGHKIVRVASPAITISNSEVGLGMLSILGGVYDAFCSNLSTFGERSLKKYHVGGKHELGGEDVYALLSDKSRKLSDQALWAQVGDIIRAAFDRAKFDALVDKIEGTVADKIEDPVKVVELTSKRFGLNEGEGKSILKQLIEGADLSRFGLHNAITRASQDLPDYDRATEFERIGGQVVELNRKEWAELAIAA